MTASTPSPDVYAAKPILVVGSRKLLPDFFACLLLYLAFGDDVCFQYIDEPNPDKQALNAIGYKRVYCLNCNTPDIANQIVAGERVYRLSNQPSVVSSDSTSILNYHTQAEEMFAHGTNHHKVTTYTRTGATPYSMASIVLNVLFHDNSNVWWGTDDTITALPLDGYLKLRTPLNTNLLACLQMLESLPAYASMAAADLHKQLLGIPLTEFEPMIEFLSQPILTHPIAPMTA